MTISVVIPAGGGIGDAPLHHHDFASAQVDGRQETHVGSFSVYYR